MKHSIDVNLKRDGEGKTQKVRVRFGPHYFVEIAERGTDIEFRLGATHHGFRASASDVSGELEKIINQVREANPAQMID